MSRTGVDAIALPVSAVAASRPETFSLADQMRQRVPRGHDPPVLPVTQRLALLQKRLN